jgi:hypothetical protein
MRPSGGFEGGRFTLNRVVKNDFLLRISIVGLQLCWSRRKNPQRISVDTPPVFSPSPPRFVKTLKMLTTEPFFTTLQGGREARTRSVGGVAARLSFVARGLGETPWTLGFSRKPSTIVCGRRTSSPLSLKPWMAHVNEKSLVSPGS